MRLGGIIGNINYSEHPTNLQEQSWVRSMLWLEATWLEVGFSVGDALHIVSDDNTRDTKENGSNQAE